MARQSLPTQTGADDAVVRAAVAGRSSAELRSRAMTFTMLALLGTILLPQPRDVDLVAIGLTVLATGGLMGMLRRPALERHWPSLAPPATVTFVALIVLFTGGAESHYDDLYVVSLVVAGLVQSLSRVLLSMLLVLVASTLPVFYDEVDTVFLTDLVADLIVWAGITFLVYRQSAGLRRREIDLVASERRFRGLSEDLHDVVYEQTLEPQRAFTYVNPAVKEVCGISPEDLYEDPDLPLSLVHPADAHIILQTRDTADQAQVLYRWNHPTRGMVWLDERITPVKDLEGRVVAQRSIIRDVTAEREAAERRERLLAQEESLVVELRRMEQLRTTLLQNLSHEVRTPLTVLMGSVELLRGKELLPDGAVQDRILPSMARNVRRLHGLFGDVMVLASEDAPEELTLEPVDLDDVVAATLEVQDLAPRRVEVATSGAIVQADRPSMDRLVQHLVANVAKHTPPSDRVEVLISTRASEGQVELRVCDGGPGWGTDDPEHLLRPFSQGIAARSSADPGAGLGMAVVSRLVAMHGGQLHLEDGPDGRGACVVVRLPTGRSGRDEGRT